ncbi:terminase small subunit [Fictibacillus phosphorivorans]|uniref:terminase small subunit n=1 Tax=Fictibacillus phosphorivorans TaxID=1221500 RepID=UPI0035ECECF9
MSEEKKKVGRPLKFRTVEEMQEKINAYFEECDKNEDPYTITGLALALDTSRETLLDYEDKDEFSDTVKKAKLKCENYAEKFLFKGKNVVGSIFNLKNNYKRWVDKQEIVKTEAPTIQIKRTRSEEKGNEE